MSELLKLDAVSRHFGGLKVLQDVSFAVRPGTIVSYRRNDATLC